MKSYGFRVIVESTVKVSIKKVEPWTGCAAFATPRAAPKPRLF
jgi:hypothetical protein